ncbi:MAG: hypothetical protein AAF702_21200 [Chloroflexota bacterium]
MTVATDKELILRAFVRLSLDERFAILQELIQILSPKYQLDKGKAKESSITLKEMQAISAQFGPPPSDEEVQQWLDERREEKYG